MSFGIVQLLKCVCISFPLGESYVNQADEWVLRSSPRIVFESLAMRCSLGEGMYMFLKLIYFLLPVLIW